mmetsp:Transcript_8017/g.28485  ORF Transcript_8017/g.28485 Transcript_8017/m.28485 type:complete len:350 (-) Transcript_8017:1048-2097(-)
MESRRRVNWTPGSRHLIRDPRKRLPGIPSRWKQVLTKVTLSTKSLLGTERLLYRVPASHIWSIKVRLTGAFGARPCIWHRREVGQTMSKSRRRNGLSKRRKATLQKTRGKDNQQGTVSRRQFQRPDKAGSTPSPLQGPFRGPSKRRRFEGPLQGAVSNGRRNGPSRRGLLEAPSQGAVSKGAVSSSSPPKAPSRNGRREIGRLFSGRIGGVGLFTFCVLFEGGVWVWVFSSLRLALCLVFPSLRLAGVQNHRRVASRIARYPNDPCVWVCPWAQPFCRGVVSKKGKSRIGHPGGHRCQTSHGNQRPAKETPARGPLGLSGLLSAPCSVVRIFEFSNFRIFGFSNFRGTF